MKLLTVLADICMDKGETKIGMKNTRLYIHFSPDFTAI